MTTRGTLRLREAYARDGRPPLLDKAPALLREHDFEGNASPYEVQRNYRSYPRPIADERIFKPWERGPLHDLMKNLRKLFQRRTKCRTRKK